MNKRQFNGMPTKICQYGADCYRLNPVHFKDYSHPHLEDILADGPDEDQQFKIPKEFYLARHNIQKQLDVLLTVYPELKQGNTSKDTSAPVQTAKIPKLDAATIEIPDSPVKTDNSKYKKMDTEVTTNFSNAKTKTENPPRSFLQEKEKLKAVASTSSFGSVSTSQATSSLSSVSVSLTASSSGSQMSAASAPAPSPTSLKIEAIKRRPEDYFAVVAPKGEIAKKLEKAAPYNFFLTTIADCKPTHSEPLSITFLELLDSSLGELECSLQINFMIDILWLMGHYYFSGNDKKPLLILYGDESAEIRDIATKKPNVTSIKVQMNTPFGIHHSKMSFFGYTDGSMRVVVSTANLYEDDWHNRTQGVWISPRLPPIPEDKDTAFGDSPTGFRDDLIKYLMEYKIPKLQPWITRIRKSNFSEVNVFFVGSVPGGHRNTPKGPLWGHPRLGHLLAQHCAPIPDICPIVAQSSSIGSLGTSSQAWIQGELSTSFRRDAFPIGLRPMPAFKMIYPTLNNVIKSHDNLMGGGCLPYMKASHDKQPWLKKHLQQWSAKSRNRNQAMPHIKTYCRWSEKGVYWFMLTSANLSKAAWGCFNKTTRIEPPLRINSYEAGVLFIPRFVIGRECFPLAEGAYQRWLMPYDIPLVPYSEEDEPFFMDYLQGRPPP